MDLKNKKITTTPSQNFWPEKIEYVKFGWDLHKVFRTKSAALNNANDIKTRVKARAVVITADKPLWDKNTHYVKNKRKTTHTQGRFAVYVTM